jgi:dTMP kinase
MKEEQIAYAASTFYAADRYIDFKREWQDAYLSDITIVSDRYTTANQLYQATK